VKRVFTPPQPVRAVKERKNTTAVKSPFNFITTYKYSIKVKFNQQVPGARVPIRSGFDKELFVIKTILKTSVFRGDLLLPGFGQGFTMENHASNQSGDSSFDASG
jgi:hypothetical protein